MVSVVPERSPFTMSGSYQPMAPPNSFGGVGGLQDPGAAVGPGGAIPMPDIIRDGNNNSNRTIPYARVVGINNEEKIKQIEQLRGGSLAFIGKPPFRKRGNEFHTRVTPGGVDSFSNLASLDHVSQVLALKDAQDNPKSLALTATDDNFKHQINQHDNNGSRHPSGTKNILAPNGNVPATPGNIFRPGSNRGTPDAPASCFLYPNARDFTVHPNEESILKNSSSKRPRQGDEGFKDNAKIPTDLAKCVLDALYQQWAVDEEGPQPFTRWTPDGLVIYKYETSEDPVSSTTNPRALDYELDQKQGAMFNIAVQGPCLSIDWTGQTDLEAAKRCVCLPRNNYYLLVVATMGKSSQGDDVLTNCRLLRTTSHDMHNYANSLDWMGLKDGEVII